MSVLRRHPLVAALFVLALAAALWLLVEVASGLRGWSGRAEEPLAPWMTVGYVARAQGLDPRQIDARAGFPTPAEAGHPLTLAEIASRRGKPVEAVYAELERVLAGMRPGPAEGVGATEGAGAPAGPRP